MDLTSFKKKFKKVETLLTMIEGVGEANEVEKDLLKLYLQDLIDEIGGEVLAKKIEQKVKLDETKKEVVEAVEAPAIKAEEAPKMLKEKPEMIEVIPDVPVAKEKVEVPSVEKVKTSLATASMGSVSQSTSSNDMDALFESEEVTDLSHKLSLTKVSNIAKSMGINEKIFTIKELFGGNQETFNEVLSSIHEMNTYDEAVAYLKTGVAESNNWSSPNNIKKAKKFLKLVQRRFV